MKNISTKSYGQDSTLRRCAGTRFTDPGFIFDLQYASSDQGNGADDMFDELEPGAEVPIIQYFTVSEQARAFSAGELNLELLLSDPHTGKLRSIAGYKMDLQVSSSYHYNPRSQFLLVVNSQTPNQSILQIIDFIENGLHLRLDIYNLGLTGSFINPATGQNILKSYVGKTIIICGNNMTYFSKATRSPWDLLDPWEVSLLARERTNFLFPAVAEAGSLENLRTWGNLMLFPAHAPTEQSDTPSDQNLKNVVKSICTEKAPRDVSSSPWRKVAVKKKFLRKLESTLESQASSASKQLRQRLPLRRFLVVQDKIDDVQGGKGPKKASQGAIMISEGLPRTAKCLVEQLPLVGGSSDLSDHQILMIVSSIPFEDLTTMFWNMASAAGEPGISSDVLYRGLEDYTPLTGNTGDFEKRDQVRTFVDAKARNQSIHSHEFIPSVADRLMLGLQRSRLGHRIPSWNRACSISYQRPWAGSHPPDHSTGTVAVPSPFPQFYFI